MKAYTVNLLKNMPMERGTKVIEKWMQKEGRAATLKALHVIFTDLLMTELRELLETHMEKRVGI